MSQNINITLPHRPGTDLSIFQYYIVISLCDNVISLCDDVIKINEVRNTAKQLKEVASRLCIDQDAAKQMALAFSDDAESYCAMFSSWASAGIGALNILRNNMLTLLQNVEIDCLYIHICSEQDYHTIYNAICSLFPEARIHKREQSMIIVTMPDRDVIEDASPDICAEQDNPHIRAVKLLARMLTDEEKTELAKYNYLSVPSTLYNDRVYLIPLFKSNKIKVRINGMVAWKLCVEIVGEELPPADQVLVHKLMIETDERAWLAKANRISAY